MGSCLIQICCLSVTFTLWYFVSFVCGAHTEWGGHVHLHMNACLCFSPQIVISSQAELSLSLPLLHADTFPLPPSTSHCQHPQGMTDRNQSLSSALCSSGPAQVLPPDTVIFKRGFVTKLYAHNSLFSGSHLPFTIVILHNKVFWLLLQQLNLPSFFTLLTT